MKQSKRFTLNTTDWRKWGKNTLTFLAPALLVFLVAIQTGATIPEALIVLKLWGLNVVIDLLKKFVK